jgi:hypothetical protein
VDPVQYLEAVQFTAARQRAQRQELERSVQDGQWRSSHDPLVAVVSQVSGQPAAQWFAFRLVVPAGCSVTRYDINSLGQQY